MGKVECEEALSLSPSPWSNRWAQHMPKQPVSASCCRTDLWSWTNREKSLRAPASGHEEIWASHRVKFWRKAVKLQALLPSLWLHSLWQLHYLWKMTELCLALLENSVWCAGMKVMHVSLYVSQWMWTNHTAVSWRSSFFFFFWFFIKTRQTCFDNTLLVLSYAVCRKIMNANFTSVRVKRLHGNAQKQQTALLTLLPDLCFTVEHQKSVQRWTSHISLWLHSMLITKYTASKQENVLCQTQIDSVRLKRNDFFYLFFIFLRRLSL